jgi:hypothetical protein
VPSWSRKFQKTLANGKVCSSYHWKCHCFRPEQSQTSARAKGPWKQWPKVSRPERNGETETAAQNSGLYGNISPSQMLGSAGFNNWPWPIKTTAALTKIIRKICCKMLQDVGDLNSQTLEPMATSHAMQCRFTQCRVWPCANAPGQSKYRSPPWQNMKFRDLPAWSLGYFEIRICQNCEKNRSHIHHILNLCTRYEFIECVI